MGANHDADSDRTDDTVPDTTTAEPPWRDPGPIEGPGDITPADDVYREGDEVLIVHGPGSHTRLPASEFYNNQDTATSDPNEE